MAADGSVIQTVTAGNSLRFAWKILSQNVANNTTTVLWSAVLTSGVYGRIDSTASKFWSMSHGGVLEQGTNTVGIGASTQKTLASGTIVCQHDSQGKFSETWTYTQQFAITYSGTYISTVSVSLNVNLDALPRKAYLTSAPNFTDEDSPAITYSNPSGATVSACISLTGAKDDVPYRRVTGGKYTFTLTDAEKQTLINATNGASRTVYFVLNSVINGTYFYSSLAKTFSIVNGEPTITATVTDVNEQSIAFTGNPNILIGGHNKAQYAITASGKKGATIVSYKATHGGTAKETATGTFDNVTSGAFTFEATDSRGQKASVTIDKTFIDYYKPTCNIEVEAPTTEGKTTLNISGIFYNGSFGKEDNGLSLIYQHKTSEDAAWGEEITVTLTKTGNNYKASLPLVDLDYRLSHTFKARVADSLIAVESAEVKVKTIPIFDWSESDFNFNVPVTIQGRELDFIEEQGYKDGWQYIKWASGKAECWQWYESTVNLSKNLNGAYYTDSIIVQYPFEFTDNILNVNGGSHSHINWARAFADSKTYASFVVIGNASQSNVGISVHLHAVGYWK